MYGHTKSPYANGALATDLHAQPQHRPTATVGSLAHSHYPNYNLYHTPATGHPPAIGHAPVSAALAHRYANALITAAGDGPVDGYSTAETEALLRRRDSRERRESSSNRRGSGSAADPTTGPPGKKQQRFEIVRKLGSGTYGRVSLAMDHKAGEEVAIKVIRKSAIENTSDLIRIRREIRIMSALKHPNIIEIKEVFENEEKIILVMEYASGGELYDFVGKHGPLTEDDVRRLFRQVVSAVYYCHRHGVAHRDLKLENILLDKDMGAKIADFGLSNYFTEHSLLRTFCGSPLYASPEIINGTPYKGPEVDCWSLGVLLYTLAYSSMPFDGRDFNRMARQIKRGAYYEPDPPSSASMLIRSMLRVCPDRRAAISEIAAHWWLNFDENETAIADLPENQVLDSTPLYIRQETMMIQSFGEENEMFAEFTHLSESTRKKIEEFRRRRREAEWYLVECQAPLKKQSKKRSSSVVNEQQKRQSSQAVMANQKQSGEASGVEAAPRKSSKGSNTELQKKSQSQQKDEADQSKTTFTAAQIAAGEAGGLPDEQLLDNLSDPLNRLKALESRLFLKEKPPPCPRVANIDLQEIARQEKSKSDQKNVIDNEPTQRTTRTSSSQKLKQSRNTSKTALKMSVDDLVQEKRELDKAVDNATAASLVSAVQEEGNRMVNSLLEEAMKGTVSADLIEKIRFSEAYKTETFVKEILESVLAAQTKPAAAPAPAAPITRSSRSKSKPSSLTKIPSSGSSSAAAPLPDVIIPEGDKISNVTVAPDVVATVSDIFLPQPQTPQTSTPAPTPILPATAPLPPLPLMKLIYETVPEDSELQLTSAAVKSEIECEVGEPPSTPASSEQEEDVCSTDFEDLGSEEDEDEAARRRRGDESPLSAAGSFASTHSHLAELPEIHTLAPAETNGEEKATSENGENEDNPFLRGLSKRLSRGKYERSKFVFGRGVSIEESPRSSRRQVATEKVSAVVQLGKLAVEGKDNERTNGVENGCNQLADGRKSPRGRRYSEGDKVRNALTVNEDRVKAVDSDLPNQDADSPKPEPEVDPKLQYEKQHEHSVQSAAAVETGSLENGKIEKQVQNGLQSDNQAHASLPAVEMANPNESATLDLLSKSQRRRQERAKFKKGFLAESPVAPTVAPPTDPVPDAAAAAAAPQTAPVPAETAPQTVPEPIDKKKGSDKAAMVEIEKPKKELVQPQSSEKKQKPKKKLVQPSPNVKNTCTTEIQETKLEPVITDKADDAPVITDKAGDTEMSETTVKSHLDLEQSIAELVAAIDQEDKCLGQNEKTTQPDELSKNEVPPTDEKLPKLTRISQRRASDPHTKQFENEVKIDAIKGSANRRATAANLSSIPNASSADQRRHSYRSAVENSLNDSQDNDKNLPKSPTAPDYYSAGMATGSVASNRASKYYQPQSTGGAVQEPLWLQYAREETHRHQQQSPYHHGYVPGDYKSSYGHGYDDEFLGQRSHLPQSSAYRVGSTYQPRETSPPRSSVASPILRNYAESTDSTNYSSAFGHQTTLSNAHASRGRKPKPPLFRQQSSDELISSVHDAASKRFAVPTNAAVAGYTPSYSRRTTASGDYYPSLYDDNAVYRRSHYDLPPPEVADDWKPNVEKDSNAGASSNQFRVFQPKGLLKRRSQSLDKSQMKKALAEVQDEQLDANHHEGHFYAGNLATRPTPSDVNSKSHLKSILKKQGALDADSSYGRSYGEKEERKNSEGDGSRPLNFIERIRRRLSNEKSPEPDFLATSSNARTKNESTHFPASSEADFTPSTPLYSTDATESKQRKKRSVLDLGRRKTAEIRYGAAADTGAGYGSDYHYVASKRPTSPAEKAKGFFGGSSSKSAASPYHYYPSYTPYQSTQTSAVSRDLGAISSNYASPYRKPYQSSGYRPSSHTPTTGRHWYEDNSMY